MNFEQPQKSESENASQESVEEPNAQNVEIERKIERQLGREDKEWREHVSSTLDTDSQRKKGMYESQIREFFGEEALREIEDGDKSAYFEKKNKQQHKPPALEGFLEHGTTNEHVYLFDEKYGFYPRGWVNGEVEDVEYVDDIGGKLKAGSRKGGEFRRKGILGSKIFLYRTTPKAGDGGNEHFVSNEAVFHELGHANDWESDQDLNIIERQDLLLKVLNRMNETDAYDTNDHYHKSYLDGTKRGSYRAVKEYWADICAEYFCNPEGFQKSHPKDFELVDAQAKKNDATFNVLDFENRGAFDPHTGELKEKWR